MWKTALIIFFCLYSYAMGFQWGLGSSSRFLTRSSESTRYHFKTTTSSLSMMSDPNQLDETTKNLIESLITKHNVVLFMKGSKLFPQCGFSNTAVRILEALNVNFETVNVLEDDRIRNGIKIYSSWPTIPQLYVNKEFIGGSDIMIQLYNSGELAEMIEVTRAK